MAETGTDPKDGERFDGEGNLIGENGELLCDRCGDNVAALECVDCKVPFCFECKADVHKKGKWLTHTFLPIMSVADKKAAGEKREFQQMSVLKEIVESEKEYLKLLGVLTNVFVTPIRSGKFPELTSNKKTDVTVVFSTISLILQGNLELLKDLEQEITKPNPMVGAIFLDKLDNFKLYNVYCNHAEEATQAIMKLSRTSSSFKQFLETAKENPACERKGISDFLIKPFQRVLQYPLLLRELLKATPENHPDYPNMQRALDKISTEADAINKNKAGSDNLKKMISIRDSIDGLKGFKFMENNRRFVKEGTLMKISKNKEQERHFFLFNDILIYTARSKISSTQYVFKGMIWLDKMQILNLPDTASIKNAIQITRTETQITYIIWAKTPKLKQSWLRELELQREDYLSSANQVDPNSVKLLTRPVWAPDSTVDNCVQCNVKFTFRTRKHHCRYCGQIFCGLCSDFEIDLPEEFGYDSPQRVCLDCNTILSKLQDDSKKKKAIGPSRLVHLDRKSGEFKAGYLVKKGHRRRNWTRRFFVLWDDILYYFESEEAAEMCMSALERRDSDIGKGQIKLAEYSIHAAPENKTNYRWSFVLQGKKSFLIRAETQGDYDTWFNLLARMTTQGPALRESFLADQNSS
eukprot:TRINITY_DN5333_c0_g1_i1.p1 TRINITY_DN5333_c0_g1~~TRINITY_DN5333_c0_g1_i1.p1  ORF type:complete len:638 (+),score=152.97 TRINITY_DN5333_c0_g1_i1:96-2009(+)